MDWESGVSEQPCEGDADLCKGIARGCRAEDLLGRGKGRRGVGMAEVCQGNLLPRNCIAMSRRRHGTAARSVGMAWHSIGMAQHRRGYARALQGSFGNGIAKWREGVAVVKGRRALARQR